jgi:hypothetical protein
MNIEGMLETVILTSLSKSKKPLGYQAKLEMFDKLFANALSKLEDTFTEKHYEVYFDKIANHFDGEWKKQMQKTIFEGCTGINIHYIPRQGLYLISIEEVAQCKTLDKAFLFDMNQAMQSINHSFDYGNYEGGDGEDEKDKMQPPTSNILNQFTSALSNLEGKEKKSDKEESKGGQSRDGKRDVSPDFSDYDAPQDSKPNTPGDAKPKTPDEHTPKSIKPDSKVQDPKIDGSEESKTINKSKTETPEMNGKPSSRGNEDKPQIPLDENSADLSLLIDSKANKKPKIPLNEPGTPFNKPETSSNKPVSPAEIPSLKHKTLLTKPNIPPSKLVMPLDKPETSPNKLNTSIYKPDLLSEKPKTPLDEPKTSSDRSPIISDKPATPLDKPVTPSDQPNTPLYKPDPLSEKPKTPSDKPATPSERSAILSDKPVTPISNLRTPVQNPEVIEPDDLEPSIPGKYLILLIIPNKSYLIHLEYKKEIKATQVFEPGNIKAEHHFMKKMRKTKLKEIEEQKLKEQEVPEEDVFKRTVSPKFENVKVRKEYRPITLKYIQKMNAVIETGLI